MSFILGLIPNNIYKNIKVLPTPQNYTFLTNYDSIECAIEYELEYLHSTYKFTLYNNLIIISVLVVLLYMFIKI